MGVVEDERPALVAVSLPWRMARHVEHGGGGVERSPEQGASPFVQRVPRGLRLHDGHQPQLGDEPVVVGGELAVDAARERVGRQLSLQLAGGVAAPRVALGEPWKGARRRQSAHGLGDDVVVRRRPAAPERREVLLVPAELGEGLRVVLEEVADARPVIEQPAHPHPAREPDTELDPARPVDAGQEGVARPPRAELGRNEVGVPGVAREPPRGREHREVVVAGELPDRLDVARDLLVPVVDPERQGDVRGAPAGDGVEEPVGVHDVGPRCAEHVPVTGEQPVGGGNEPSRSLTGNQCTRVSRNRAHEHPGSEQSGDQRDRLSGKHLPPGPPDLSHPVAHPPADLARGHPAEAAGIPAKGPTHGATLLPKAALSATAIVARVVATMVSTSIGIGAPSRTAWRKDRSI